MTKEEMRIVVLEAANEELLNALKELSALLDDIFKSNNIGKLCFQDYARLNTAPMDAKRAIKRAEELKL